jgi:hypothetical protein
MPSRNQHLHGAPTLAPPYDRRAKQLRNQQSLQQSLSESVSHAADREADDVRVSATAKVIVHVSVIISHSFATAAT